jgi:uncharacterized membrane protein
VGKINRPKIDIPKTKIEWMLDIVGYIALTSMVVLLLMNWSSLPDKVPAHFGATGEVDRWGSKMELLIIPGIAVFLHVFMMIIEKVPETHNYPARLNESNARAFYTNSRQTLNYLKNLIDVMFAYTVYNSISIALGSKSTLGWPFFIILGLIIIVTIWKTVKMFKIK